MQNNIIDRIKLPFRKDKELYLALYNIIGFYPHNISYYKQALLHKSVIKRTEKGNRVNNERMEFLGDAILDAIVGDIVYRHFPKKREGFLTNTRSKIVQRDTLNRIAKDMGVEKLIKSACNNTSHNNNMGGNAFEALVGAIYLDRGYTACMKFMQKRILKQLVNIDRVAYKEVNFKSKLLEWTQKNHVNIKFNLLSEERDDSGSPKFTYMVELEGVKAGKGEGFSKKESQQRAAKKTLDKLRREPKFIDEVFAAKTERTRTEEVPVVQVPNDDYSVGHGASGDGGKYPLNDAEKHESTFCEEVYRDKVRPEQQPDPQQNSLEDDFDLSMINHREKSKEDIIAAAETAAFGEGNA